MKKHAILFNIILYMSFNCIQAQELKTIVTSIEIGDVLSDTVILRWKSNIAQGDFTLYYHTSRISDVFVLREAELAVKSNFTGVKIDSYYEYEYAMKFYKSGSYYFAIVANDSTSFDTIAQDSVNKMVEGYELSLLPEINITIQPISVVVDEKRNFQRSMPTKIYNPAHTITSLNLKSYEDIFHLQWSVYPKDLPQYIFTIYRSRYPIAQYNSAVGLPIYATVTNQFVFEDRGISFETPYYYAVVIKDSKQWTPGINIFTTPAVLLRKSPPLQEVSKTEYIKRKEQLPSYPQEFFSEEDIEAAVRRTLSNLQILADTNNNQSLLDQINNQNSMAGSTIFEEEPPFMSIQENSGLSSEPFLYNNIDLLTRADSEIKTANPFAINNNVSQEKQKELMNNLALDFTNEIVTVRKDYLKEIEGVSQNLLIQEKKDYDSIIKNITTISNEINSYNTLTESLVYTDKLQIKDFKSKLNAYYDKRDNIRIKQYQTSGHIKGMDQRRQKRENNFLTSSQNIITQYNKKYNQIFYNFSQKEHISIINNYKQELELKKTQKINNMVSGISLQMINTNVKDNNNNLKELDRQIDKLTTSINEQEETFSKITTVFKNSQTSPVKREYFSGFDENQNFSQRIEPKTKLSNIQYYYQEVRVEKIPEIKDNPKETWIYENRETWIAKQELWKIRTRNILGENYERIASKWMVPSYTLAVSEGRRAYNAEQYQEAMYLLNFATNNKTSLMMLGQSYYRLGAYRDAFSVFITALNMGIPEARYWLDNTSEKILERKITENNQ